jgi:hypothetical protein
MGSAGKELVASGREPADTDQAAFQGIHALNPLLVIDEARHDDQTDVMTEFGWRRFKDLDGSERLMTMSVRFSDQHQRWADAPAVFFTLAGLISLIGSDT